MYVCLDIFFKDMIQTTVEEELYSNVGSWSQRLWSTVTIPSLSHCGYDTEYNFCPITFKLHTYS